jgi:hypothetical protein
MRLKSEDKGERFASTVPNFLSMALITTTNFKFLCRFRAGRKKPGEFASPG